jgi:hypothetical protein
MTGKIVVGFEITQYKLVRNVDGTNRHIEQFAQYQV